VFADHAAQLLDLGGGPGDEDARGVGGQVEEAAAAACNQLGHLGGCAQTIALNGDYAADAGHRWALEPYHYEPDYNAAALARLRDLIGA